MKILIADDSAFMRGIVKNYVVSKYPDSQIEEAENGEVAVSKFKAFRPDLVLLDIIMPIKDGINVLAEIGNAGKIIVISAAGQEELVAQAKKLGALNFIAKPFDFKQLGETIEQVLNN